MIKPGIMCWINHRCNVPENVGKVVEVISLYGVIEGINDWHVHSQEGVLCYHEFLPLAMYRKCFGIPETHLTPINTGDPLDDDANILERDHETSVL